MISLSHFNKETFHTPTSLGMLSVLALLITFFPGSSLAESSKTINAQ
jgi:hypothetical protein